MTLKSIPTITQGRSMFKPIQFPCSLFSSLSLLQSSSLFLLQSPSLPPSSLCTLPFQTLPLRLTSSDLSFFASSHSFLLFCFWSPQHLLPLLPVTALSPSQCLHVRSQSMFLLPVIPFVSVALSSVFPFSVLRSRFCHRLLPLYFWLPLPTFFLSFYSWSRVEEWEEEPEFRFRNRKERCGLIT